MHSCLLTYSIHMRKDTRGSQKKNNGILVQGLKLKIILNWKYKIMKKSFNYRWVTRIRHVEIEWFGRFLTSLWIVSLYLYMLNTWLSYVFAIWLSWVTIAWGAINNVKIKMPFWVKQKVPIISSLVQIKDTFITTYIFTKMAYGYVIYMHCRRPTMKLYISGYCFRILEVSQLVSLFSCLCKIVVHIFIFKQIAIWHNMLNYFRIVSLIMYITLVVYRRVLCNICTCYLLNNLCGMLMRTNSHFVNDCSYSCFWK